MHSEAMAKYIPSHHHVCLHPVHGQPVHAQELREQGVAMALHDKLQTIRGGGRTVSRKEAGCSPDGCGEAPTW